MTKEETKMADEGTRTLEVRTQHDCLFQIDVPDGWKITFSKVNPQAGGYECMALRIYEADEKQRACFTSVVSFRDISIPFRRRVKTVKAKTSSEVGGKRQRHEREAEESFEWVNDMDGQPAPF